MLTKFDTFVNEAKKKKDPKKLMDKHRAKIMRDDRLDSGANLGTKVVPDKKKKYKRNKKVDINDD